MPHVPDEGIANQLGPPVGATLSRDMLEPSQTLAHGDMQPADVYLGELDATICFGASSPDTKARIWRISPLGVDIVDEGAYPADMLDPATVAVRNDGTWTRFSGAVVGRSKTASGIKILAIRFDAKPPAANNSEQRKEVRWECSSLYAPTGAAYNPLRFGDLLYFRISNVSKSGMALLTSMRNKHLLAGTCLDCMMSFPLVGPLRLKVRISYTKQVSQGGRPELLLGVEFTQKKARMLHVLHDYLLHFGTHEGRSPSYNELRRAGFSSGLNLPSVDHGSVRTPQDYREVLNLRHIAYQGGMKPEHARTLEQWADPLDNRSRILTLRHRGKLLASCRLVYNDASTPLESEHYLPLPSCIKSRESVVEVSRACTHPDYRGAHLLLALIRQTTLTVLQSQKRFILFNCTQELLPLYARAGFHATGATFELPYDGKKHHLVCKDLNAGLSGAGGGPLQWALVYGAIWKHIEGAVATDLTLWQRIRLGVYKFLYPMNAALLAHMTRPRRASPSNLAT